MTAGTTRRSSIAKCWTNLLGCRDVRVPWRSGCEGESWIYSRRLLLE